MKTILNPTPPYDLSLTLDLLSRYAHPITDVAHDNAYWRALLVEPDQPPALLRVHDVGNVDKPALQVERVAGEAHMANLAQRVGHILGVESDHRPFYTLAKQDETLWRIVEPLRGLRWLRTDSVFEALMLTIIEQQIAWTAAQRAQYWLVGWGGHQIEHEGRVYSAFPAPAQIAAATVEDLTPLKITFKRMNVMIAVAGQIVAGELDLEAVRGQSPEAGYKTLTGIKGVGHWTAAWTLQRTLGYHNYVGYNDVALQAAVNHYFYGGEGRIPEEQVQATFAPYGQYAGLAANYTIMRWVLDRYD